MEQFGTETGTAIAVIDNQFEGASNLINDMTEMDKSTDEMREGDINGFNLHEIEEIETHTALDEDANATDTVMNTWIIDEICKKFDSIEEHQERLQEMIRKLPAEDLRQLEAILRLDDRHLRVNLIQFHRRKTRNAFFQIESDCIVDEILEILYHQMKKHFNNLCLADNSVRDDKIHLAGKSGGNDRDDKINSNQDRVVVQSLDLPQNTTEFTDRSGTVSTIQDSLSKTKMAHQGANSVLAQIRNLTSRILNAFIGTKAAKSSMKQPKARKEKRKMFSCIGFKISE